MSADGLVVVGDGTTATGATAIRWTPSGGTEALPRPTANAMTFAYDTNQDGSVTVGTEAERGSNYSATGEALLWNLSGVHYVGFRRWEDSVGRGYRSKRPPRCA